MLNRYFSNPQIMKPKTTYKDPMLICKSETKLNIATFSDKNGQKITEPR